VDVRIRNSPYKSASFDDHETAVLYGKYWEMILKEKRDFAVLEGDMLTVLDVMMTKYKTPDSAEMRACEDYFREADIWHTYINTLTHDVMLKHAKRMLTTPIIRGGNREKPGTGTTKLPAPATVLRKFAYLSSAINHCIKLGANIDNPTVKVITYIREYEKEIKNGQT